MVAITEVQLLTNSIWADSDNGSTVALQASGRGSIPRRSTKKKQLTTTAKGCIIET